VNSINIIGLLLLIASTAYLYNLFSNYSKDPSVKKESAIAWQQLKESINKKKITIKGLKEAWLKYKSESR